MTPARYKEHPNSRLLNLARKKLGWTKGHKHEIFQAVADALAVPLPQNKRLKYALLGMFTAGYMPEFKCLRNPVADSFLESYEWRRLRMVVLKKCGARCECCGATPKDGVRIHVDHIKPRRYHPELALEESNLQVLCEVCNHGKGSWDETDWRPATREPRESYDSPVPGTATATSRTSSFRPRLLRKR